MRIRLKTVHGQYVRASDPEGAEKGSVNQSPKAGLWEEFDLEEVSIPQSPQPPGNGLRHDWRRSTGAFLFSEREHWFPDSKYFASPPEVQDKMLTWQRERGATHFLITTNVGRGKVPVGLWDGANRVKETRMGLERIIKADLAPAVMLTNQLYFKETLEGNLDKFITMLDRFVPQIEDLTSWVCPMWEIGDIFTVESDRRKITQTIRAVTKKPIGVHERSLEGPYRKEVIGLAPTISLLQFGFKTDVERAEEFVLANKRRLDRYGCETACFEHSIPSWGPWSSIRSTLEDANKFGKAMIKAGCIFDMNGLARR